MPYLTMRLSVAILLGLLTTVHGADPGADGSTIEITSNEKQEKTIQFPVLTGIEEFKVWTTPSLSKPFQPTQTGRILGYSFTDSPAAAAGFYRLQITPKTSNEVAIANLLNRIAYGPTPDDLERIRAIGPDAYIAEQLAPEKLTEDLEIDRVVTTDEWRYVTLTGTASSSDLYVYLTGVGDAYIDDLKLVKGTQAEVGASVIKNGDFETGVIAPWTVSTNLSDSSISTTVKHGGNASLHLVSSSAGTTKASSVWQALTGVTVNSVYTLSYWYKPGTNVLTGLTIRLSGSGIESSPDPIGTKLANTLGVIDDLRAWHVLHAVRSKKQLLEVLLQFLDNHFVTQYSKTKDYFDQYYDDPQTSRVSVGTEYREIQKWRQALLNPSCTFYDLLKISAESPAMIIYLDTVNSKGNGSNVANENYAREVLELFTFGVDNGYDQNDITVLSRAWTGWSVDILNPAQANNPLSSRSTLKITTVGTNLNAVSNILGVWSFRFKSENHNTNAKAIFQTGTVRKTVPARFGAPYAGRDYTLALPARNGTNGIKDGYEVIAHLANQPFTQEFLSVKLCRLFVHEDFATGYDFTDPNLSPEGQLVRACMASWESTGGQIRAVLSTILNSSLFRTQLGAAQKVKTPLEFTVGAIRALRAQKPDGGFTADTDGYGLKTPMNRMGSMSLFDRAEPDGYPESAAPWISAGTLAERLRFVQTTCMAITDTTRVDGIANGNKNMADPTTLLKQKLPSGDWNDANRIADFFLGILFPAEGKANLDYYKAAAVSFLNTADDGVASSPLTALGNTTTTYDTRIRGMVAMLMTTQRFQEQ